MKRKLTACLFILAIWMLFPVTTWARETTLTTMIPSSHTLHMDITGNGTVIVDDIPYTQTADLQIKRGAMPKISVVSTGNIEIAFVSLNEQDITNELRKGTYIMPQMCLDTSLNVVFEETPGTPQTGDSVPVTALCLAMALSFAGVFCCLVLPRKNKI